MKYEVYKSNMWGAVFVVKGVTFDTKDAAEEYAHNLTKSEREKFGLSVTYKVRPVQFGESEN